MSQQVPQSKESLPQYQAPPTAPGFVPPQQTATIIVTETPLGQDPKQLTCPKCNCVVVTQTKSTPGLLTHLLCGGLCLLGCWLGCCLIPCCISDCQDTEHRCPNCKHFFGIHRKIN
ncbi:hypothetical protein BLOT_006764 [Blomia tropicalis]|nr:hypothetical protein BLOT_006764 [Blomia tropicalis]